MTKHSLYNDILKEVAEKLLALGPKGEGEEWEGV
jgi:hypothetical protein